MREDFIKPNKDDRIAYTFSKAERVLFLEKLKSIGIPFIKWVSKEEGLFADIEEYSFEHLINKLVTMVIDQDKRITELEKA